MSKYNTNMASEFYVLSMLHRLGVDAALTLGNKKAVDIFIHREDGRTVTVDVKGIAGAFDWPADNLELPGKPGHFIVLVSYNGRIEDPSNLPSVWIIPSIEIGTFTKVYGTRRVVSRSLIRKEGNKYKDAWATLVGDSLISRQGF